MDQYGNKRETDGYVQIPISDKSIFHEISGDFTLPDYQPEIKRLLRVTANVLPASKYVGDRSAEFSGGVDYYVIYTGSDNQIYCAPISTEYKIDVPFDGADTSSLVNTSAYAAIIADNVSGRVTSPRRLSIKCRLRARARAFGDMAVEDSFGDGSLEVLYGKETTYRTVVSAGEMLRLSDEIINSGSGDVRVILADGKALVDEVSCSDGAVSCRGNLYLKLLMSREDGSAPYSLIRKIPFSQSIASKGVCRGDEASARATVCEMSINVDEGRILIDIGMLIETHASTADNIKYVKDVYSTEHRVACDYKMLEIPRFETAINGNFTLSDSMTLDEAGISPECSIVDVAGTVCPEAYSFEEGRCIVNGRAKYDLILMKENEYSSQSIEFPFRYACPAPNKLSEALTDALFEGEVVSARARVDGERIGIDSEISMSGGAWETAQTKLLDSVSFGDEIVRRVGEYTVCYPSRGESLWSVAKRYGAPIDSVIAGNKLSSENDYDDPATLDKVKYLMI